MASAFPPFFSTDEQQTADVDESTTIVKQKKNSSAMRPDTEIKLYSSDSSPTESSPASHEKRLETLRELKELKRSKPDTMVLRLAEGIRGNVFNRPYPFVAVRAIPGGERLPDDLKNDGDPSKDYFTTVRAARREKGGGAAKNETTIGYVFMGFKVKNLSTMRKWICMLVVSISCAMALNIQGICEYPFVRVLKTLKV